MPTVGDFASYIMCYLHVLHARLMSSFRRRQENVAFAALPQALLNCLRGLSTAYNGMHFTVDSKMIKLTSG